MHLLLTPAAQTCCIDLLHTPAAALTCCSSWKWVLHSCAGWSSLAVRCLCIWHAPTGYWCWTLVA